MGLLDGEIAQIIGTAIPGAGVSLPATLIKVTPGARVSGSASSGTHPTTTSFSAQGLVSDYRQYLIDGEQIVAGDRQVKLFGATIDGGQIPQPGDRITIQGETYSIVKDGVTRDAASAVYTCQCRR